MKIKNESEETKVMKTCKFLSALLALLLVLSSIPVFALTTLAEETTTISYDYDLPSADKIDEDGINTMGELVYAITNSAEGQTIKLSGDIDMGGITSNNADFGTLKNNVVIDGAGYAIYNFTMLGWSDSGLFSVASDAHIAIKNLDIGTVKYPVTATFGGANWPALGILIGDGASGNSDTSGTFSFDIENVNIYAKIGSHSSQAKGATFGAMIGKVTLADNSTSTIKNCNVYDFSDDGINNTKGYVGAFVGQVFKGTGTLKIESCVNHANVQSASHAGGFVGYCANYGNTVELIDCVNLGNVTSTDGDAAAFIANAAATPTIKINSCINIGDITSTNANASQAIATGTNVTVQNCAYVGTVTGTDSITADDAGANSNVAYTTKDATTVAALNAKAIGCFKLDSNNEIVLDLTVPQMVGVQTAASTESNEIDVRFVAVLKDKELSQYQNVGFKISATYGEVKISEQNLNSKVVFSSLLANEAETMKTYEAADLGGAYIVALSITGIPAGENDTVIFTVTPYATDSAANSNPEYGTAWKLTFVNGALTDATPVSKDTAALD